MSKFFRIFSIILVICLLILPSFVQAFDVDMNLNNQTYTSSTVSALESLPEANLGLSNILSIILIVIGALIILLAIAIIIRLKN